MDVVIAGGAMVGQGDGVDIICAGFAIEVHRKCSSLMKRRVVLRRVWREGLFWKC